MDAPVFPNRERHPFPELSSTHSLIIHFPSKSPVNETDSMFPNKVSMERDAPSSEPMVYSFIYIFQSPRLRSLPTKKGKSYSHFHRAPHTRKAYIQWGMAWFPKRVVYGTAVATPLPCSLHHNTFHLGLVRPEPH